MPVVIGADEATLEQQAVTAQTQAQQAGAASTSTTSSTGASVGTTPPVSVPSPADPGGMALWHSCMIGDYLLPPSPHAGSVEVEVESGGKKDKKKAAGKSKSNTTKQGAEDCKIKIKCEFDAHYWNDSANFVGWGTILTALDPDGANGSDPFAFSHPDATRRNCKSITIDKVGAIKLKGYHVTVELDASEWTEPNNPKTTDKTGTPTADAAAGPTAKQAAADKQVAAFGGPAAAVPSAGP